MGYDAIGAAPPKKSGCLKWTCGCLACVAVVICLVGVLGWYFLGRWTPGDSAWERLPPNTVWAMEVHDAKSLFERVVSDRGIAALLRNTPIAIPHELLEHASQRGGDVDISEAAEFISQFKGAYHFILPNTGLIGGTAEDPEDAFIICKLPPLMRWLIAPSQGEITLFDDSSSEVLYSSSCDGWYILAPSRGAVQNILDNWGKNAAPLGPTPGRTDAYVMLAINAEGMDYQDELAEEETASAAPGHFMLEDPFAASGNRQPEALSESVAHGVRFMLLPTAEGWGFYGEFAAGNEAFVSSGLTQTVDAALGGGDPEYFGSDISELEIGCRIAPSVREYLLRELDEKARERVASAEPRQLLGWKWLREAWLAEAGTDWVFAGEAPPEYGVGQKVESGLNIPPVPQFALGWTLRSNATPRITAEGFTEALTTWLDSLKAPGGPLWAQNVRETLDYRVEENKVEGVVLLPPAPASAARPAWRFSIESAMPMGWAATYPGGILQYGKSGRPLFTQLGTPGDGSLSAAASWSLGDRFIDSFHSWALDRSQSLPEEELELDAAEARNYLDAAKTFFKAFPEGCIRMGGDVEKRRFVFKGVLPFGVAR